MKQKAIINHKITDYLINNYSTISNLTDKKYIYPIVVHRLYYNLLLLAQEKSRRSTVSYNRDHGAFLDGVAYDLKLSNQDLNYIDQIRKTRNELDYTASYCTEECYRMLKDYYYPPLYQKLL